MNLEELRKKIDEIDTGLVELIGERIRVAEAIGEGKEKRKQLIGDIQREYKVLEHVKGIARSNNISQEDIENIYQRVIAACKRVQGIKVVFQGELGAYSEEAAFYFLGSSTTRSVPQESLEGVFKVVAKGEAQFGVVPVENSLEGTISRVYDLLLDFPLMVCGEIELRIIHCLIAGPGAGLDTIKRVYSHPQALAQCRNFLKHLNCEPISTYDTAGSVKMIKEQGHLDSAAIASARAAEIYGMEIIAREIEDNPNNFTRFFVLSKEDAPPSGDDKTSIVFSVKDKPGILYDSLKEFASRNVNLTKLESRPTRLKPWEYNFYLDFVGHREDKAAREALKALEKSCIFVKILGSYPKAR